MSNTHLDRAKILTEALPYIQRYNGKIVVVNCGGVAMDAELRDAVATDITMLRLVGIKVVLVHGIGPEVKQALAQSGRELVQKEGVYQIGPEAMEILQEVLCGIDGGLMTARAAEGCTGELVRVDSTILETFLAQDYTPVVAAVAQGADGGETVYSVSANLTAARLAVALKAEKLIHLVESTKLLRDPAAPEAPIPELGLSQVPAMIRSGVIPPEMALKANCSVEAVRSGVRSATLLDGSVPHAILLELLSDEGIGTMLTH